MRTYAAAVGRRTVVWFTESLDRTGKTWLGFPGIGESKLQENLLERTNHYIWILGLEGNNLHILAIIAVYTSMLSHADQILHLKSDKNF